MEDIDVDQVLERLEASTQRARKEGVQNLHLFINQIKRNKQLKDIQDSGYVAIFKSIFRCVQAEKTNYAKPGKSQKEQASRILSDCAAAVRLATEICLRHFEHKTARLVVGHIIEVLPDSGGRYCEPLINDYLRTLRTILEYQPHAGHVREDQWFLAVEFCVGAVQAYIDSVTNEGNDKGNDTTITASIRSQRDAGRASRAATPSVSRSMTPARASFAQTDAAGPRSNHRVLVEEGVVSLSHLLSIPNAPALEVAQSSLDVIFDYLKNLSPLTRVQGQEYSFRCINRILSLSITENLKLASDVLSNAVPAIRRLWQPKCHQSLKEEMLITFLFAEPLLGRLSKGDNWDNIELELRELIHVLEAEYTKRNDKELLHDTDLEFDIAVAAVQKHPLTYEAFRLRLGSPRSEQAWMLLKVVAVLHNFLLPAADRIQSHRLDDEEDSDYSRRRKRQKVEHPLHETVNMIFKSPMSEKTTHLQILAFVAAETKLDADSMHAILDSTGQLVSSQQVEVSNWAMLTMASVVCAQDIDLSRQFSSAWLQAWSLASRRITNLGSSRPACHLMNVLLCNDLIPYASGKEVIDAMLSSVELNAPVAMSDAALALFSTILGLKAKYSPSLLPDTSERISRWMFLRWRPSQLHHWHDQARYMSSTEPAHVLRLVATILGLGYQGFQVKDVIGGSNIATMALKRIQNQDLIDYLTLNGISQASAKYRPQPASLQLLNVGHPEPQFRRLYNRVVELITAEIESVLELEHMSSASQRQMSSPEAIGSLVSLCVVAFAIGFSGPPNTSKPANMRSKASQLREHISKQILLLERPREAAEGLPSVLGPLLRCAPINKSQNDLPIQLAAHAVSSSFGPSFWHQVYSKESNDIVAQDLMDMDGALDSQQSQSAVNGDEQAPQMDWAKSYYSANSRKMTHTMRIILASFRSEEIEQEVQSLALQAIPSDFIDFLTDQSTDDTEQVRQGPMSSSYDFVASRNFLNELMGSGLSISLDDIAKVLEYIAENVIGAYDFERSEVGLGVCLDTMTHLVGIWTHSEDSDVVDASSQLYKWLIGTALQKQTLSPHVHVCLGRMLQKVIQSRPEYGRGNSMPSARASLFKILDDGMVVVKYQVGLDLSNIFGLFILKEHDAILDDIVKHLPMDSDWLEGTAIRIFVLSNLGASWSTLIRRCLYAIVEAPGLVPVSTDHARHCITTLANELHLDGSKDLFRLFASQVIYTWLDTQSLDSLPFRIFEYKTLKELLQDVQSEITAQVVMRGRESESQELSDLLLLPYNSLLQDAFGRSAAYVIAHDAAISPETDPQAAGGATRLRKAVGKDQYRDLISARFPEILATFFKVVDREDSIIKGFQKNDSHATAYSAYDEIISSGASESNMAMSQQPSFKASCLIEEIDYVCNKTSYDPEHMWTPALYTFVFRELMKTMHSALGSLHNVTVIRRIRILVSMAGQNALSSYPLEMSLHSLRPYLTDSQCAEDVMGLFKYLISKGSKYLEQNPSFFAGIVLVALVSLRAFLDTPPESTTQESTYRKTMSKAQQFHEWLGSFASNYQFVSDEDDRQSNFKALIAAARRLQGDGNATKGTGESELLLALLADQSSQITLIDAPLRDLAISTLSNNFEIPTSPRNDILGTDRQAARHAAALWQDFNGKRYSREFSLWIARVLGRAYAGYGFVVPEIVRESSQIRSVPPRIASSQFLTSESTFAILGILRDILLAGTIWEAGVAEQALQSIASHSVNDQSLSECVEELPPSLLPALTWKQYVAPQTERNRTVQLELSDSLLANAEALSPGTWTKSLCLALLDHGRADPLMQELASVVETVQGLSNQLLPYVLHLALLREYERRQTVRECVSKGIKQMFANVDRAGIQPVKQIIGCILYLRSQMLPREAAPSDRCRWLELDYQLVANAATKCGMFKTALLFLEIQASENTKVKTSRRSSGVKTEQPTDLLMLIFRNLDDKDFFYGIDQPSSFSSLVHQLEFENAGFKSLSFRGALYDSQVRQSGTACSESEGGMMGLLSNLDLNGLSQSLYSDLTSSSSTTVDAMFETARKLEKWDLSAPPTLSSQATVLFKTFQDVHDMSTPEAVRLSLDSGYSRALNLLRDGPSTEISVHSALGTLAVLTEMEEVLSSPSADRIHEMWTTMQSRDDWMRIESFDKSRTILSCRRTLTSTISKSSQLQGLLQISEKESRVVEAQSLLEFASLARHHGSLQSSLDAATYLSTLVGPCKDLGINIDVATQFEASNVLWDQGEMTASIRMMRDVVEDADLKSQAIPLGQPELLAKLGHRISEARLEKPDEIIRNYLEPAREYLNKYTGSKETGQVYHEFASFCDQQLQNTDNIEDLRRIRLLRDKKLAEIHDLERMIKSATSQTRERDQLKSHRTKAKQWFELDNAEYERLTKSRQALLNQSLENYLLCLQACDTYDNDALRFSALWLEHSENEAANATVAKFIDQVGSRKFASLMNQWTSRLLDSKSTFQRILAELVLRICVEHPYHGMFHIFASSKTKGGKDQMALSRNAAANAIVSELKRGQHTSPRWIAIHNTNISYVRFAQERPSQDESYKQGAKIALRKSQCGQKLEHDVPNLQVPPPTMNIEIRADCDYSKIPTIARFQSEFSIASGISTPKILTAIGTDGKKYKQLFKSGNDDLRQDAIMEQVFEQVSNLLKTQRDTRQRNLGIRAYKVLPLTNTAGVIEFVQNTIPLNDFLIPAHQKHYPNDLKPNACRKAIQEAQTKGTEHRVRAYRQTCEKFHPVLRYFFMERFEDPDDWFSRRLAYTRSTAAISILGYILGLGDRHGHNILLDEKTGEVIHIDLGIAFEQGRVLPVPEVVPFRLTRDLVDGMGLTKTEGVFRRCCEFTLDALRNESYSIMTILDVLRYDPLYSWSISPVRLKRLQDDQAEASVLGKNVETEGPVGQEKKDEEGEAERALTVVSKKLSKTLSVTATVNELIQQATDEKNLALLFCGWAAYA